VICWFFSFSLLLVQYWHTLGSHLSFILRLQFELDVFIPSQLTSLTKKNIAKVGGSSLLRHYYYDSPSFFIACLKPELVWEAWKFKNSPTGTWKQKSNHKRFFQHLKNELNIEDNEEWYSHLSLTIFEQYGGSGLLKEYYNCSPILFLTTMIPDHEWNHWKFKYAPLQFWKSINSHVMYFEWLCVNLGVFVPHSLYSISQHQIMGNFGASVLADYYHNSPSRFVMQLCPEFSWVEWCFNSRKWRDVSEHKRFFEWIGEKIGFDHPSQYLNLKYSDLHQFGVNGSSLLHHYYKGSVNLFLAQHLDGFEELEMEEIRRDDQQWMADIVSKLIPSFSSKCPKLSSAYLIRPLSC